MVVVPSFLKARVVTVEETSWSNQNQKQRHGQEAQAVSQLPPEKQQSIKSLPISDTVIVTKMRNGEMVIYSTTQPLSKFLLPCSVELQRQRSCKARQCGESTCSFPPYEAKWRTPRQLDFSLCSESLCQAIASEILPNHPYPCCQILVSIQYFCSNRNGWYVY